MRTLICLGALLVAAIPAATLGGVGSGPGANPTLMGQPVAGSPIRHVIVLVQESRTFDNLFASSVLANGGPYPGVDTTQTATVDGKPQALKAVPFEHPGDPSHTHAALMAEWNSGKMDGFGSDVVYTAFGIRATEPGLA
ncbi:MAG TPA: hypothetical protein VGG70_05785, partial [Candidatus Cybelea sp.]